MADMMKEYGLDPDGGVGAAEMKAMAKELGLADGGDDEEAKMMADIAAFDDIDPENMTDEQLLAELGKPPEEEAKELKQKVDSLL